MYKKVIIIGLKKKSLKINILRIIIKCDFFFVVIIDDKIVSLWEL